MEEPERAFVEKIAYEAPDVSLNCYAVRDPLHPSPRPAIEVKFWVGVRIIFASSGTAVLAAVSMPGKPLRSSLLVSFYTVGLEGDHPSVAHVHPTRLRCEP